LARLAQCESEQGEGEQGEDLNQLTRRIIKLKDRGEVIGYELTDPTNPVDTTPEVSPVDTSPKISLWERLRRLWMYHVVSRIHTSS